MAVRSLSAQGSPYLKYVTTPAALNLVNGGPLTIIGWAERFVGGTNGIAGIMADEGGRDSWGIRHNLGVFQAEYIVEFVTDNALSTLVTSDSVWYFVEAEFSSPSARSMRTNNGDIGINFTPLGSLNPYSALTINVFASGEPSWRWNGCLAGIAFLNRSLTNEERGFLNAGYTPPNIIGLENIAFYVPLVDAATADQAFLFGVPVTMERVNTPSGVGDCGDAPTFLEGSPPGYPPPPVTMGEGDTGGSGMQMLVNFCLKKPEIFTPECRPLNSMIELGPFRWSSGKWVDETSMVTGIILGLSEADFSLIIEEDWDELSGYEDWELMVDVLGADIFEDWGDGIPDPDQFKFELLTCDDGMYPNDILGIEELRVFHDKGSSKHYVPGTELSGIFHRIRLSALECDEYFAIKFIDVGGLLTGRMANG